MTHTDALTPYTPRLQQGLRATDRAGGNAGTALRADSGGIFPETAAVVVSAVRVSPLFEPARAESGHLQFLQGSPRVLLMVVEREGFCPVSSNGPLTGFSGGR